MNRISRIQAVCFDVGGTLVDVWPSLGDVYAAVARQAGISQIEDPAQLTARFLEAWRTKTNFDYSREAWADLVVRTFGGSADQFGVKTGFFEMLYNRFTEAGVWKIHDDVVPTLEALTGRGLRLAVISNWDDRLRPLLKNLKLDTFFDVIEVSGETGIHKPSPVIFRQAVQALNVSPAHALHVGDSVVEDLQGAQAAGLRALLIRRNGVAEGGNQINSLTEVLARLDGGRR